MFAMRKELVSKLQGRMPFTVGIALESNLTKCRAGLLSVDFVNPQVTTASTALSTVVRAGSTSKSNPPSQATEAGRYACVQCRARGEDHSDGYHDDRGSLQHMTDALQALIVAVVQEAVCRKDSIAAQAVTAPTMDQAILVAWHILGGQATKSTVDLLEERKSVFSRIKCVLDPHLLVPHRVFHALSLSFKGPLCLLTPGELFLFLLAYTQGILAFRAHLESGSPAF